MAKAKEISNRLDEEEQMEGEFRKRVAEGHKNREISKRERGESEDKKAKRAKTQEEKKAKRDKTQEEKEAREIEKALRQHGRERLKGEEREAKRSRLARVVANEVNDLSIVEINEVINLADEWLQDVLGARLDDWNEAKREEEAWDDVNGGFLPMEEVIRARKEEVAFMEGRKMWLVVPSKECRDKTGKAPVSVRWVDTDKGFARETQHPM